MKETIKAISDLSTEQILEKITKLLKEKKYNSLFELLLDVNPVDIAALLQELEDEDMIKIFRLLSKDEAADVFAYMEPDKQERLISLFSDRELAKVIDEMYLDDTVDLISEMPATLVKRILKTTSPEQRHLINEFLKYPEDSAGSIMTNEFVDLKSFMTVRQSIEKVRRDGVNKETIYTCYVLDETRRLIGIVDIKALLLADFDMPVSELMETSIIFATTLENKEDVAKKISKYDLIALPVVDLENRLVGIVTVDDAIDVIAEETAEDFEKMAAITPTDESYFKTTVGKHSKSRILWLLILMFSSIFSGAVISTYQSKYTLLTMLTPYIPLLMGTGGNCGTQTSTMIIRGMATDEITSKDFFKALWKEFRIGLICAVVLSAVNGLRIVLMGGGTDVAIITSLTMAGTVVTSKLIACALPMGAKKLKLDPAIMASPLITTVVDVCSLFLLFNIALHVFDIEGLLM